MHWWFQQCPSCTVCLLPRDRPVATDSRYQLHGRLHQRGIILFLNELQWPREREYHSRRRERWKPTLSTLYERPWWRKSSLEQQYKSQHVDMGIQYVTEVVASDVSTSKFSSSKLSTRNHGSCPDCTTVSWHHLQNCGPHSESQRFPCIPTLVRSRTSCALIVCWWSSTAFQSISRKREETEESRHLYKFPD